MFPTNDFWAQFCQGVLLCHWLQLGKGSISNSAGRSKENWANWSEVGDLNASTSVSIVIGSVRGCVLHGGHLCSSVTNFCQACMLCAASYRESHNLNILWH